MISFHTVGKEKTGGRTECECGHFLYDLGWLWWPEEQGHCPSSESLILQEKLELGSFKCHFSLKMLAQLVLKHCEDWMKQLWAEFDPRHQWAHSLRKDGPPNTTGTKSSAWRNISESLSCYLWLSVCIFVSPILYFICKYVSSYLWKIRAFKNVITIPLSYRKN